MHAWPGENLSLQEEGSCISSEQETLRCNTIQMPSPNPTTYAQPGLSRVGSI